MTGDQADLIALGQRIRAARKNAELTVKGLAEKAGVGYASMRMWECGQRDPGVGGLNAVAGTLRNSSFAQRVNASCTAGSMRSST